MVTIADVAKLAGLSTGTVSRVMNGSQSVSTDARVKVNHAIKILGYKPNLQARSLRSKRTDTIALAIPELTNDYWTSIARGVQDVCQAKHYHVIICNTGSRRGNYLPYLEQMVNRVDGMILSRNSERSVAITSGTHSTSQGSSSREKPVVFVGQSQAGSWDIDNVYSDSIAGAFTLTEHLIRLGHQKIAIITGRQSSTSASNRVAGYCMALADANIAIKPELICWGEYFRKTAERLTLDLLKRLPSTTAIVAANNEIAIGVIQALEKLQVSVPERVAVVCFDDFYPDSRFASFMTVASQSPYDIGLNAAQLLVNRLNGNDYLRPQTIALPPRLIIRCSCGGDPDPIIERDAFNNVQGHLILPLPRQKLMTLSAKVDSVIEISLPTTDETQLQLNKNRNHQGVNHETFDIPYFQYAIVSRMLYRYILEREPEYEYIGDSRHITPEDQVEFAQRSKISAIPCRFPFQPKIEKAGTKANDLPMFDFPPLSDHIDLFDRFVRAARNTNVRIVADFRGIFADALKFHKYLNNFENSDSHTLLERLADELLSYQTKVVQLVCDRFGSELAFVMFSDSLADNNSLRISIDDFEAVFSERIQSLIYPTKEHDLRAVLYTDGKIDTLIPLIHNLGFDALYIAQAELCDMATLKAIGKGKLCFMGGIPVSTLINGTSLEQVRMLDSLFTSHGDYVAGVSGEINDAVPVENYLSLLDLLLNSKN